MRLDRVPSPVRAVTRSAHHLRLARPVEVLPAYDTIDSGSKTVPQQRVEEAQWLRQIAAS